MFPFKDGGRGRFRQCSWLAKWYGIASDSLGLSFSICTMGRWTWSSPRSFQPWHQEASLCVWGSKQPVIWVPLGLLEVVRVHFRCSVLWDASPSEAWMWSQGNVWQWSTLGALWAGELSCLPGESLPGLRRPPFRTVRTNSGVVARLVMSLSEFGTKQPWPVCVVKTEMVWLGTLPQWPCPRH